MERRRSGGRPDRVWDWIWPNRMSALVLLAGVIALIATPGIFEPAAVPRQPAKLEIFAPLQAQAAQDRPCSEGESSARRGRQPSSEP